MNAQEIIEYIRTSEKKTPVKVYVWEKEPVEFPGCHVFQAAPGQKIVRLQLLLTFVTLPVCRSVIGSSSR